MASFAHRSYKQVTNPHLMTASKRRVHVERLDGADSEAPGTPHEPLRYLDIEQTKESVHSIPATPISPFFKVGTPVSFFDTQNGTLQSIQPLRNSREVKSNARKKLMNYP